MRRLEEEPECVMSLGMEEVTSEQKYDRGIKYK
jgi:hypothetical protein